jgi:hypothetical protein
VRGLDAVTAMGVSLISFDSIAVLRLSPEHTSLRKVSMQTFINEFLNATQPTQTRQQQIMALTIDLKLS